MVLSNHNINSGNVAVYYGAEKAAAPSIGGPEFYDIYHEYDYDRALGRDSDSSSYVYALDGKNRLSMLGSCRHEPDNKMEGRIKDMTMAWMDE